VSEHDRSTWSDAALERLIGKLTLPPWLDPWWHLDFETSTTRPLEAARAALTQHTGSGPGLRHELRGGALDDGSLILFRRGGLVNELVRGHAELTPEGSGTLVKVRVARPRAAAAAMTGGLAFLLIMPLVFAVVVTMRSGISTGITWLVFEVIAPVMWVVVVAANYTSALSEAKDLRQLISAAVNHQAPGA
jgi:hypothetical protein